MGLNIFLEKTLHTPKLYFYSSTFFNVVFFTLTFSLLKDSGLHTFFNSDTLYLSSLYQDIVEMGGSVNNWYIGTAPNFFPDMVLFLITSTIANNFIISFILYSIVQYLLIVILINQILKVCVEKKERYYILSLGNFLLALIPLSSYFVQDFNFSFHLMNNAFHNGALVNALIALNFFIRIIQKRSILLFVLLFITIFIGIISDRFFTIYFVLPSALTTIVSLLDKTNRKVKFSFLAGLTLITIASYTTFNLLKASKILLIFNKSLSINFNVIKASWSIFYEQFSYYLSVFDSRSFVLYFSLISLFLLGYFIYMEFKTKRLKSINPKLLLTLFLFCFIPIVLCVPVLAGIYSGWDTIRYNFQAIVLALLFAGLTLNYSSKRTNHIKTSFFGASFIVTFIFTCSILFSVQFYSNLNNIVHYYPEKVKTIDIIAKRYNLQFGVSNYWTARHTMMFSKEKVRPYNCFTDMAPWYYFCNKDWFYINPYTKDSVNFNFVIIDGPEHEERFKKVLGTPLEIIDTNDIKIYITKPFRYNETTYQPYYIND